jgi:hypothetical protein
MILELQSETREGKDGCGVEGAMISESETRENRG